MRAGVWKPRTRPGTFEGAGEPALQWLRNARERHGVLVGCEVASATHVRASLSYGMDLLWIGARTAANPFMVQEIAETLQQMGCTGNNDSSAGIASDVPVLVKNPVNPDIDLWIGGIERLCACGVRKVGAVLRGVTPDLTRGKFRNDPAWHLGVQLRSRHPEIPLFCDPSHMGGSAGYVQELSQRALDLGFDGLMIEVHPCPEQALSDAAQQLTPSQLCLLLHGGLTMRNPSSPDGEYVRDLAALRSEIDEIDDKLLELIARRMDVSGRIGELKRLNNVAILQSERWDDVLSRMLASGREMGLSESLVRDVFYAIHAQSVNRQTH